MKTIVNKSEIASDPNLTIVKAFRMANKRAGEAKRFAVDESQPKESRETALNLFNDFCGKLRDLAAKADEAGFKIWVNFNGRTGHTYSKDYKPTLDEDNNWEQFEHYLELNRSAVDTLIFPEPNSQFN
jgi:hypothetical protein